MSRILYNNEERIEDLKTFKYCIQLRLTLWKIENAPKFNIGLH